MAVPLRCAQRSPLPFALSIPTEAALLLLPSSGVLILMVLEGMTKKWSCLRSFG